MKWLKKFETFDFSQTLPVASKSDLTLFYHCDDCDSLWKSFNKEDKDCKFCQSDSIEELSKDEWYETVGNRLDDDEIDGLEAERNSEEEDFMDLYRLNKKGLN